MTLDITDDFDIFDNQEEATWQELDAAGDVEEEYPVQALREDVGAGGAGYQGGEFPQKVTWHVKRSGFPIVPGVSGRLVTSLGTYVLRADGEVGLNSWGTRWVLPMQLLRGTGGP